MQLIEGRTGQEYNKRKGRRGAFWEDRYHATAVSSDHHLAACMRYIDLNMVRAGVVRHPEEWPESGFCAIQQPRQRYRTIDIPELMQLFQCRELTALQALLRAQVDAALEGGRLLQREPSWTEALAIGGKEYVETFRTALDTNAGRRSVVVTEHGGSTYHALREVADHSYEAL